MKKSSREEIVKATRLVWDSLDSHLDYSVKCETLCETCGTREFHAKAVREYVYILDVLTRML